MLVKLHGTSGSGKSTVARELMARAHEVRPIGTPGYPEAYCLQHPGRKELWVIGSYENDCGGMDTISDVQTQIDLIHHYAMKGDVFYEGLLMSTYYGVLGKSMERYGGEHVWAFLDTPIELCIERIKARRLRKGNTKPLNEENTRKRMKPIDNLAKKLILQGRRVITVDHHTAADIIWDLYGAVPLT